LEALRVAPQGAGRREDDHLIEIVFIGEARQTRHKLGQEVAGALVAEGDGGGAMDGVTHAVMDPARAGFAEIARRHTRHPFGMFGQ
jgi:hypothetical protein